MWKFQRWINLAILLQLGTTFAEQNQQRLHLRREQTSQPRHLQNVTAMVNDTPAYFRITVVGTIMEADDAGKFRLSDELDAVSCIPIIDGTESHKLYSINLPDNFINKHSALISAGKLYVAITNTRTIDKEERVVVTKNSTISIMGTTRSDDGSEYASTIGKKTIAVVRISTKDSSPTPDAQTIESTLFNPDTVNLRTQYMNCSFGQLEWTLAPAGVVEVYVDQPVADFKSGAELVTAAQEVMINSMGIEPSKLGDKVMMCLPPGTGGWIASSGVNHWRSQYNDEWCLSLTATMHEIGHMIGLIHANEDGVAYGDSTDYMAAGHKDIHWPRKCFNGYKNSQLGWYRDRQLNLDSSSSFDEGQLLKLASFVDFNRADYDEYVLIVVANELYLAFNLARDFNIDTEEKRNQVTITAPGESGSESLAGLKEQEAFRITNFQNTGKELVIEVCTRDRGKLGAYMMWISVAFDKSVCDQVDTDTVVKGYQLDIDMSESPTAAPSRSPVTQSPTLSPSQWPSDVPSEMPSFVPSANPSNSPTVAPSFQPSTYPTRSPTSQPTESTVSPAPSSGSVTLFPESDSPTPQLKIDYQELLKKREKKIKDSVTVKLDELEELFDGGNQ